VRFILPYPPGGPTDIMGRVVAQALTRDLPQPVVVENRAGAAGAIGTEAVARAAPDGATFLVNASAHVIVPHMVRVPYDALADFAPVTNIASVPLMLVVTPGLPVRSVAELVAHAKANPGRLSFASSSNGGAPHLAGELFKLMAGVDMAHVPYRGSGQAVPDLIAGNVQVMFDSMPSSAGAVREGRLRALAVTTAARQSAFPGAPDDRGGRGAGLRDLHLVRPSGRRPARPRRSWRGSKRRWRRAARAGGEGEDGGARRRAGGGRAGGLRPLRPRRIRALGEAGARRADQG
jgi:tripartite-type tricarboxylate transporter receptor subunit TctC